MTFRDKENTSSGCNASPELQATNPNFEPLTPTSPLWQKIREILKQRFGDKGEALDKSWFAKLDIELQAREEANTATSSTLSSSLNKYETKAEQIKIKCPNSFVRSWIKANYGNAI